MSDKTKKTPARNTTQEEMEVDTNREGAQKAEHSGQREDQPGTSNIKRPVNAETDASSNGGTKRIRVDADDPNKVMDDQRRGRVELNKEQRDNVLRYILACHLHITSGITGVVDYNNEIYKNIHVSQQVTSIFCTIHSCLRQESLISGSLRTVMKEKDHSILVGGIEKGKLQHEVLLKVVLKIAESFGLKYIKPRPDETNHWYGTASPILCFINMFKVRMNELRVGHGSMVSKKADGNTYNISLSQYGLYNVHHPLLEGITIPPEKRSGMAQSLGPMTSLVCLARTDNDQKYSRRWRSAVKRDLAFIPEIDSIIEACCGKKAEVVKGLYSILADIILITTSRESKRASFPACMMYSMLSTHEAQHYIAYDGKYTNPTDISWFNFSGIGAGALYKMCCCMEWISPIRPESTDILPEIVFHSIWGTYGTDFGILEYMTAYSGWRDRSAIGDGFKKFGTSPPTTMRLITIHKYSKLSSANQTGLLSLSSNPIVGKSAFSGKHKQVFTDEFIDYLESSKATTSGITTNIEVLKNTLMQVKENLIAEIKANRIQSRGTTKWHSMADSTTTSYGAELDEEPTTKGKLFMQSDK